MFKVNDKYGRTKSPDFLLVSLLLTLKLCFYSVFIAEFDQVNTSWVAICLMSLIWDTLLLRPFNWVKVQLLTGCTGISIKRTPLVQKMCPFYRDVRFIEIFSKIVWPRGKTIRSSSYCPSNRGVRFIEITQYSQEQSFTDTL